MRKEIVLLTLLSSLVWAWSLAGDRALSKSIVKSKEEIEFVHKSTQSFGDFGKVDAFQGSLIRHYESHPDLQVADFYRFADVSEIKIDKVLCKKILAQIFGPLDKISLKVQSIVIYSTEMGPACEAQVLDPKDPQSKIPERRVIAGFINMKPTALVFRLSKKADTSIAENIRVFWAGLR